MSSSPPAISVIMAVYGSSLIFLQRAVQSILQQTFANFEFIIVNDGSDATTTGYLESIRSRDARINVLTNKKNLGLTKSLNRAISAARGAYIARMDDDDIAAPHRLSLQYSYLREHHFDLIGSQYTVINPEGKIIRHSAINVTATPKQQLMRGNFFAHSTLFGTRTVFNEGYNERFILAQDYEFLLRIAGLGYRIGCHPENLLKYQHHSDSLSVTRGKRQELYALYARWLALKHYGYALTDSRYLIRPLLSLALPRSLQQFLIDRGL